MIRNNLFLRSLFLLTVVSLSSLLSQGQTSFTSGYFIDNDSKRTECLIKNLGWKNNPDNFKYKTEGSEEIKTAGIESVKEFGIYQECRYIRVNVQIDYSSNDIADLSTKRAPEWSEERVFLKVLIDGKASLFSYESGNLFRLFYSVDNDTIKQLIFKEYWNNDAICSNTSFRQQLWIDVRCKDTKLSDLENILFSKNNIEKYFTDYNECVGDTLIQHDTKSVRERVNLKISAGTDISALSISNPDGNYSLYPYRNFSFDKNISYRISLESELFLPIWNNKWSIMCKPAFQSFNFEKQYETGSTTIDYSTIEFPVGLRYYVFLNKNLKVFFNGYYISNIAIIIKHEMDLYYPTLGYYEAMDVSSATYVAAGAGVEFKNLSCEFLINSNINILNSYVSYRADFNKITLSVRYKLFHK